MLGIMLAGVSAREAHAQGVVGTCIQGAQYPAIQAAVNAAPSGAIIKVCPGRYQEQVVIEKPLTLEGITSVGSGRCLGPASNQRVGVNRPDQPEHAADLGEEHCRRDHQQPDRGRGQ